MLSGILSWFRTKQEHVRLVDSLCRCADYWMQRYFDESQRLEKAEAENKELREVIEGLVMEQSYPPQQNTISPEELAALGWNAEPIGHDYLYATKKG